MSDEELQARILKAEEMAGYFAGVIDGEPVTRDRDRMVLSVRLPRVPPST